MNKQEILKAIAEIRENSKKRKFSQKFDLVINLKDLDLKKTENQVENFVLPHYSKGKKVKVCALIGPELYSQKESVDFAIGVEDFPKYEDKKTLKKLAREYDYFIAQATIMPKVATTFGKVLGPKGKMPNPKAGCVVPPNANLREVYERLQKLVRLSAKTTPMVQCIVGNEEMKDEEIADNVLTIYKQLVNILPSEKHNIKGVKLKLTMGKPVKIGEETSEEKEGRRAIKWAKKRGIKKQEKVAEEKAIEKEEVKEKEIETKEKEIEKEKIKEKGVKKAPEKKKAEKESKEKTSKKKDGK